MGRIKTQKWARKRSGFTLLFDFSMLLIENKIIKVAKNSYKFILLEFGMSFLIAHKEDVDSLTKIGF